MAVLYWFTVVRDFFLCDSLKMFLCCQIVYFKFTCGLEIFREIFFGGYLLLLMFVAGC